MTYDKELSNLISNDKDSNPDSFSEYLKLSIEEKKRLFSNDKGEVIASGIVEISGHDVKIVDDESIFYIDDAEFWKKYEGSKITIEIGE